jgi:hypothetical protein
VYEVQCENDRCPEYQVAKSVADDVDAQIEPGQHITCGQCGYPTARIEP